LTARITPDLRTSGRIGRTFPSIASGMNRSFRMIALCPDDVSNRSRPAP
jgi:hypothetical protein